MIKSLVLLLLLLCFCFVPLSFAEEIITRSDGSKIAIHDNGTWEPYSETIVDEKAKAEDMSCTELVKDVNDKMTGNSFRSNEVPLIISDDGKKGFNISLMSGKKGSIIFGTRVAGAGCIKDKTRINILFENGSRLQLLSDNKFNCKGNATVYFGGIFGKTSELKKLSTNKISAMRIWTTTSFVESSFTKDHSERFYHILNCLQN